MSDSKTLVALAQTAAEIETALAENNGELTPELEKMLAQVEVNLPDKVDTYSMVMSRMDALSDFYKRRADMFLKLSRAAQDVQARMKDAIKIAMETMKVSELQGQDVRFKLVNSTPSVVIENEDLIPQEYKVQVVQHKTQKTRIADDLKMGVPVPGAHLEKTVVLREFANTPGRKS